MLAWWLACRDQRRCTGSGSALEVLHDNALYKYTFSLLALSLRRIASVTPDTIHDVEQFSFQLTCDSSNTLCTWDLCCVCYCMNSSFQTTNHYFYSRETTRWCLAFKSNVSLMWPWPLTSWPHKLIVSLPCPSDYLFQLASKSVDSFSKYRVYEFGSRQTNGWMNERTSWWHNASICHFGGGIK